MQDTVYLTRFSTESGDDSILVIVPAQPVTEAADVARKVLPDRDVKVLAGYGWIVDSIHLRTLQEAAHTLTDRTCVLLQQQHLQSICADVQIPIVVERSGGGMKLLASGAKSTFYRTLDFIETEFRQTDDLAEHYLLVLNLRDQDKRHRELKPVAIAIPVEQLLPLLRRPYPDVLHGRTFALVVERAIVTRTDQLFLGKLGADLARRSYQTNPLYPFQVTVIHSAPADIAWYPNPQPLELWITVHNQFNLSLDRIVSNRHGTVLKESQDILNEMLRVLERAAGDQS